MAHRRNPCPACATLHGQTCDLCGRRDIRVDAVFDIETESWDVFVLGAILYSDGRYKEFRFGQEVEMVTALLSIQGTIWAHFGGGFDYKMILDVMRSLVRTAHLTVAGSRIVMIEAGLARFCDSFALVPMKLEKFTAAADVKKEELGLPCHCGKTCGGYCAIRRDMSPPMYERLRAYLKADCKSLMAAMRSLREFAAREDLDLGATVGSSAWRNAKRTLGLPEQIEGKGDSLTKDAWNYAKSGHFGGRVQVIRPGFRARDVSGWTDDPDAWERVPVPYGREGDVSSMYPWTLKTFALPWGPWRQRWDKGAAAEFRADRPGIYTVSVNVPQDTFLPVLPVRTKAGTAYPTGRFSGTWSRPEIHRAMEHGAVIEHVTDALVWDQERVIFAPWVDHLWNLRANAPGGKSGPLGEWLKLYLNSLTGKLGSRADRESFILHPGEVRPCQCTCGTCSQVRRKCNCLDVGRLPTFQRQCKCGGHYRISEGLWASWKWKIDPCSHTPWAMHLTSHGRIALHTQLVDDGEEGRTRVYCDTDSCHGCGLDAFLHGIGNNLGEWADEGPWADFCAIAPKVYTFRCLPGCHRSKHKAKDGTPCGGGHMIAKAKGITLGKGELPAVGGQYEKDGIRGFGSGAKAGEFFKKSKVKRTLSIRFGDRLPDPESRGELTRAPTIEEIELDPSYDDT